MIRLEHPEALLLLLLLAPLLVPRGARPFGRVAVLRALLALAGVLLLAGPWLEGTVQGRDLLVLVDRSRSVPDEAAPLADELIAAAARAAQPGDRLGLVSFAREPRTDLAPTEGGLPPSLPLPESRDATDVGAAIAHGLALLPEGRPGSLLLLSDGEATGGDALAAARQAARRGVRIDVVPIRRAAALDVSVDALDAPGEVATGEPFLWTAWVAADRAVHAEVTLLRDGVVVARTPQDLQPGRNRLVFRERFATEGSHRLELQVAAEGDTRTGNDRALAAVRATGTPAVLCLTPGGREDRLTRSLAAAGFRVLVSAPETAALDLDALDAVRTVVLEDVPARALPAGALETLASWVTDLGGGLLMTGGRASFGSGGWRRSAVEDVLPVTLEVRQEQRRFSVAMALALDRSGSMAVAVAPGVVKMDLANRGAMAAIELLSPMDEVAVLAIDSSPHLVVPLQQVEDPGEILARVSRIESEGGGIFTATAVHAAADQLAKSRSRNRHIVIFADAADAEEPGDLSTYVPKLVDAGVSVSVIALGSPTDSDAAFLRRLAADGQGRCSFVSNPADLPRVFAEETLAVALSSFAEADVALLAAPGRVLLGLPAGLAAPHLLGYSVAYLRPDATAALLTDDDTRAPALCFRQAGLGRSAAFLGEADGEASGPWLAWDGYGETFGTVVRWLAGTEAAREVFADTHREGHELVVDVELARGSEALADGVRVSALGPDGEVRAVPLRRTPEGRFTGRLPLDVAGVWRPVLDDGRGGVLALPPVAPPQSPEHERPLDPHAGGRLLAAVAALTGGRADPPPDTLWSGERRGAGVRDLRPALALAALALLLAEIAVRRLDLRVPQPAWLAGLLRRLRLRRAVVAAPGGAAGAGHAAASPALPAAAGGAAVAATGGESGGASAGTQRGASGDAASGGAGAPDSGPAPPSPDAVRAPPAGPAVPTAPPAPGAPGDLESALQRAKRRARRS